MRPPLLAGFMSMGMLRKLVGTDVDKEYLDAIERGLSGNVTIEMNLAIGDLADVARKEDNKTIPGASLPIASGQEAFSCA